jgi:hypothetical protein
MLRRDPALLIRHEGTGKFNSAGKWVPNSTPTEIPIRCLIQPDFDGTIKKFKPEGVLEKDCQVIYTEFTLYGASESLGRVADILEFNNQQYEVSEIQNWVGAGRLRAFMVLCIRVDKL